MTSNPQLLGPLGPWVVATARVLLALIFLYSGQDKLRHWQASVAEVRELGLPIPTGFAAATILTQLLASAAVAFDLSPRIGASLLAVFTVAAALLGHRFWLYHGKKAQIEVMTVLADLGLVGGLLLIVAGSCWRRFAGLQFELSAQDVDVELTNWGAILLRAGLLTGATVGWAVNMKVRPDRRTTDRRFLLRY